MTAELATKDVKFERFLTGRLKANLEKTERDIGKSISTILSSTVLFSVIAIRKRPIKMRGHLLDIIFKFFLDKK